jgi:hypothetical protein
MRLIYTFALIFTVSLSNLAAFIQPHAVQHIKQRHWHNANSGPKTSHFNKSMTVKKLDAIATKTIQQGSVRNSTHGQGRKTHQFSFTRPIGRDTNGNRSKTLRVVTDPKGEVITAFPV